MKIFDYKSLTKEELGDIFQGMKFGIPPMWHQLVSLSFAADHNRIALFHGVGTGKTLTALWCSKLWNNKRILVVCPSSAFSAWERDISNYTNYSFEFLTGSGQERKSKIKKKKDVYIINYEGLKTIFCTLMKGKGWKINYKLFVHSFDNIILDEVHKCKNYKSLQSKICYQLSKMAKNVIGLTGTAVDNSLLEVFNIYKVIDLGKALGSNFFNYRMKYFKPGLFEWVIKPGAEKQILKQMTKSTLSFDREECFDLPELQEIVREINPLQEFLDFQHKIISDNFIMVNKTKIQLSSEEDEWCERRSPIRAHLLRELPCGFIYYKNEKKQKEIYRLKKNPKIEALLDLIDDSTGKVIIFYHFTEEGNMISEELKKYKYKFISIQGGQSAEIRIKQVKKFTSDKKVKCAVVQESAGAEGWDGSIANIVVFFSPVASPKTRKQCVGRIHRKGQKSKCLVVDLVLKHSIDKRVLKNRSKRFDFVKETMAYIQEYGGIEEV